jgi:5-methylcytosine-specific restriction endonuclease McrA
VQFAAGATLVRKLEEARTILSNRSRRPGLADVIEASVDAFLNQNSPFRRKARRERASGRRSRVAPVLSGGVAPAPIAPGPVIPRQVARGKAHRSGSRAAPVAAGDTRAPDNERRKSNGYGKSGRSRHVPAAVRDAVFARDGGRCAYVGANGIPCGSRHLLHIDHVEPFGRGGGATLENLRLLCAPHNQMEAERVYGSDWMRRSRGDPGGA